MDKSQTQHIISIFHEVTTEFPEHGQISGALIIAKDSDDELLFVWKSYPKPKRRVANRDPEPEEKFEVIMKKSNIQKIMINYHDKEPYVLISTIQQPTLRQFTFSTADVLRLLNLAQILAINAQPDTTLVDAVDFITESYVSNKDNQRLIDISIDDSKIVMPSEIGMIASKIEFVKPDMHILSQLQVHPDYFSGNPVTSEELSTFDSLEKLNEAARLRGIHADARWMAWPILFNVLPFDTDKREEVLNTRTEEYVILRNQWESLSKNQLKHFRIVRDAFSTIRVDVKRTHPPDVLTQIEQWSVILTRILRTFTMWNLDVRYTQGLNDLAVNIMVVFIPVIGHGLTEDQAEALVFWCFSAFVEMIGSGLIADNMMAMQARELKEIMAIIDNFHPACGKWLVSNNLDDLSFLISSFILAYGRSFKHEGIAHVWEALVTVEAPWLFLRYFSASLLILSFPSFHRVANCSSGRLVTLMDQIFHQQDVSTVIGVALSMMEKSEDAIRHEIEGRKKPVLETPAPTKRAPLFEPISRFTQCYESLNLFT